MPGSALALGPRLDSIILNTRLALLAGASTDALLNSLQTETDAWIVNWAQGNSGVIKAVQTTPTNDAINGTFDADSDWTKEAGWTIGSGTANYNGGSSLLYQSTLTVGREYTVTFTITSISSGGFAARIGGTIGTYRTSPGTYTETMVADTAILGIAGNASTVGSVDNVTAIETDVSLAVQELTQQDTDILAYTSPSRKYVVGPDGNLRYAAHNIWSYSEDWGSNVDNSGPTNCTVDGNAITVTGANAFEYKATPGSQAVGTYKVYAEVESDITVSNVGFRTDIGSGGTTTADLVAGEPKVINVETTLSSSSSIGFGLDTRSKQ